MTVTVYLAHLYEDTLYLYYNKKTNNDKKLLFSSVNI